MRSNPLSEIYVFRNKNGKDYFVIIEREKWALLRDMASGVYYVVYSLYWDLHVWGGSSDWDSFGDAYKRFMSKFDEERQEIEDDD